MQWNTFFKIVIMSCHCIVVGYQLGAGFTIRNFVKSNGSLPVSMEGQNYKEKFAAAGVLILIGVLMALMLCGAYN